MRIPFLAKVVFFTLLMPGTVTVLLPWAILNRLEAGVISAFSLLSFAALALGVAGCGVLLFCIWEFASIGRGTLAPFSPTRRLVVRGAYRYTRNPMYLAVLCILVAEALLFRSLSLAIYSAIVFACFQVFIVLYEEPHLRKQFGDEYRRYCTAVPRWAYSLHGYHASNAGNHTA